MACVTGQGSLASSASATACGARRSRSPRSSSRTSGRPAPSSPASPPAMELLAGVSRYVSVPLAAVGVSALVLRGSFHRVEHVLLALSAVFVAYIVSGVLAHPDWGAAARGLVVPSLPLNRDARPRRRRHASARRSRRGAWRSSSPTPSTSGCGSRTWRYERIDVVGGRRPDRRDRAVHRRRLRRDAARAGQAHPRRRATPPGRSSRSPAALASTLFAARACSAPHCWLRRSCRCRPPTRSPRRWASQADVDDRFARGARVLRDVRASWSRSRPAIVLIPGAPLIPILFLTQALNAVLLLPLLAVHARARRRPRANGRPRARPRGPDRHRGGDRGPCRVRDGARRAHRRGLTIQNCSAELSPLT